MPPDTRRGPALTTPDPDQTTPRQEGRRHDTRGVRHAEVEAARHLADRAKRLSLRAAGHGQVSVDDLLDVVAATGALVDVMLGGPPVVPAPGLDPLDAVRAAGIPVPDPVPDDEDAGA